MYRYIIGIVFVLFTLGEAQAATSTYDIFVGNTARFKNISSVTLKAKTIQNAALSSVIADTAANTQALNNVNNGKLDKAAFDSYTSGVAKRLPVYKVGTVEFPTLQAAVSTIGATPATLIYETNQTLTGALTVPVTLTLDPRDGAQIIHGTYALAVQSSTAAWDLRQKFSGTGVVSGLTAGRPEWFGAVADGTTNDSTAIQRCITASSITTLQVNKIYYIPDGISITTPNKSIVGGGTFKDGTLTIGLGSGNPVELHAKVQGVKFVRTTRTSNNHAIVLQRARAIELLDNTFVKADHAIHINQVDAIQHVNRLRIQGNKFSEIGTSSDDRCNYALYSDGYNASFVTKPLTVGDIDFIDNTFVKARISHVYLRGMDGFSAIGNRLYFDGSVLYPDADKRQNIFMEYAANIVINGNQLFVPGHESVYLSHVRDWIVSNNVIIAPGQVDLKDGIKVENGALSGSDAFGLISNNIITYPSKSGISLGANTNGIVVQGNNIRYAGTTGYYYGDTEYGAGTLASISHYGVDVDSSASKCFVHGNLTPHNLNNMSTANTNSYFASNYTSDGNSLKKPMKITLSGTETVVDVTGKTEIHCAQTGLTTVATINGGVEGQEIHVRAINGNTTFSGTAIVGGPYPVPANKGMIIKYFTNPAGWYVTGKSF